MKHNSSSLRRLAPDTRQGWMLLKVGSILTGLASALHIAFGSNPIVVCTAAVIVVLSLYPVAVYGFLNLGAVLVSLVGFRHVGFPLIAKLAMGQPLDTYLLDPLGSFGVVLLGLVGYLAAFLLAARFSVGQPLLQFVSSKAMFGRISFMAAAIGIAANMAVAFRAGKYYDGLTIAEFFVPFLHLALITAVARAHKPSGRRRSVDVWVAVLLIAEVGFAMVLNSRMALMETFLCFVVTIVAFEVRIKWKHFILTGFAIGMMAIFVTPVFLYVRSFHHDLSWTKRINATLETVGNWSGALAYYLKQRDLTDRLGWHLNYYGSPQNVFERMTLINHVDALKVGSDSHGFAGLEDLCLSLKRVLPRMFSPDKPLDYSQGSWLYERIGLPNSGPFATASLIGTGYAAFGWVGAFSYPLVLGLACFLILKKISGWRLQGNLWAIYLLLRIHNHFVEGSSDAYVLHILRILPQDFILLWILEVLARGRFLHPWRGKAAQFYGK